MNQQGEATDVIGSRARRKEGGEETKVLNTRKTEKTKQASWNRRERTNEIASDHVEWRAIAG